MYFGSAIGILNDDGSIKSIFCHSDGRVQYCGYILEKHYNNVRKVKKLIAGGDLISLGSNPNKPRRKIFEGDPDFCFFESYKTGKVDGIDKSTDLVSWVNSHFTDYMYLFNPKKSLWNIVDFKSWKTCKKDIILEDLLEILDGIIKPNEMAVLRRAKLDREIMYLSRGMNEPKNKIRIKV